MSGVTSLSWQANVGAGAAEPGLDLIDDEEHVCRGADPLNFGEVPGRRHDDPGLALYRLEQHRDGCAELSPPDGGGVAVRNDGETGHERPETASRDGIGGEADDRRGAPVEVTLGDE
jgi:hypothetical protein